MISRVTLKMQEKKALFIVTINKPLYPIIIKFKFLFIYNNYIGC